MGVIIPPFSSTEERGYKFLCTFQILPLERSDRKLVWVEGGIPPYNWEVSGTAFTLDSVITNVQYNYINSIADADVDTKEIITVTDDEGSFVTCNVRITTWDDESCCGDECRGATSVVIDAINTNDQVAKNTSYPITVAGGVGPFTWFISEGVGITLTHEVTETGDNVLTIANGTCGVNYSAFGEVTVSDACGSIDERSFIVTSNTYFCKKGFQTFAAAFSCDSWRGAGDYCLGYAYTSWVNKGMYHYMYRGNFDPYPAGGGSYYPCANWADGSTSWDSRYCIDDGRFIHCNTLPPCGSPEDCMREKGSLINCDTCDDSLARCLFGYSEVMVRTCVGDPECH